MEEISKIQNQVWKLFKQALAEKNTKNYTKESNRLLYQYRTGSIEHSFALSLIFTYAMLLNDMLKG